MAFALRNPPPLYPRHKAYPFQLEAVQAVKDLPYAAIFHEQGLGKTKIALDLTLQWLIKDVVDTVFIVTKKTLVENWVREIGIHCHIKPSVLSVNRKRNSIFLNAPVIVYVIHYEVISANLELIRLFLKTCRVGIILDEAHKIKNPDSRIAKSLHSLADGFERKVIMTGTPVANRPYDLWSQIWFLDRGQALGKSFKDFRKRTDLLRDDNVSQMRDESDETYGESLASIFPAISDFSLRETKESVGLELPSKSVMNHDVDMAPKQMALYKRIRNDVAQEFKDYGYGDLDNILTKLLRLLQCASNPILLDEHYQEQPGKMACLTQILNRNKQSHLKTIVWTNFIANVEWLIKKLDVYDPVKVHGKMAIERRQNSLDRFMNDQRCCVLVATPGAAKEGLTLTVANHAIFYDRSFRLDDYLQAQDRIHRISQKRPCWIHNLIARNTIDEWVGQLLSVKKMASQVAQGDVALGSFKDALYSCVVKSLQPYLAGGE